VRRVTPLRGKMIRVGNTMKNEYLFRTRYDRQEASKIRHYESLALLLLGNLETAWEERTDI
jgi:hypothetical protein